MDAAVALQRKKTIEFLCIVDFPLSKQGIFLSHSHMLKATFNFTLDVAFIFALYSAFPHVIVNMGEFLQKRYT